MNTLRIAKIGKNAITATLPNDFIFNPEFNTPKIIKQAFDSPVLGVSASETFRDVAHGLNYTPFVMGFCKLSGGRVVPPGGKDPSVLFAFTNLRVNATNVKFGYYNDTGGNYSPVFKYIATEIPLAGTPSIAQVNSRRLVIAKSGFNALTETNPNNLIFDSRWGTFKYFVEDVITINVPGGTPGAGNSLIYEETVYTHGLGYYPFFNAQAEFSIANPGVIYSMPISFADGGVWGYDDIYLTDSALIYRSEVGDVFGSTFPGYQIKIYYKIYSTDLGF